MPATAPPAEITSEAHVYRFKVSNPGGDTPQIPTIPGLVGHRSCPSPYMTPIRGKVTLTGRGEVGQVEFIGNDPKNGQRATCSYTRDDLASGDYHGTIPRLVFNIVEQVQAHHRAIMKEVQP